MGSALVKLRSNGKLYSGTYKYQTGRRSTANSEASPNQATAAQPFSPRRDGLRPGEAALQREALFRQRDLYRCYWREYSRLYQRA